MASMSAVVQPEGDVNKMLPDINNTQAQTSIRDSRGMLHSVKNVSIYCVPQRKCTVNILNSV
ncbi:hypothetical protein DPMN_014484 [Dreissena polymorpha]|uniref:Uncharacterized protein n=1 Tax=Dreissena polymorpha TaxID=45954 RepID=A0A9D4N632_DREPO|nr:hypothetical protein DPMN_014484 [Dreissena polymorpha]